MLLAKQNFSFKQEVMLKKPFLKDELDIVSERQRGERERERVRVRGGDLGFSKR